MDVAVSCDGWMMGGDGCVDYYDTDYYALLL